MHRGLAGDHTRIPNGRADASKWTNPETEILGAAVRAAHPWSLDPAVKALCCGRGLQMTVVLGVQVQSMRLGKEKKHLEGDQHPPSGLTPDPGKGPEKLVISLGVWV